LPSTLKEELVKIAPQEAGLMMAARAIATEDYRRAMRDHAQRVRESHKAMAKAAGAEDSLLDDPEAEDMGDINISGDHYNTVAPPKEPVSQTSQQASRPIPEQVFKPIPQPEVQLPPKQESQKDTWKKKAATVALAALAGAVPAAGLGAWLNSSPQEPSYSLRLMPPDTMERSK